LFTRAYSLPNLQQGIDTAQAADGSALANILCDQIFELSSFKKTYGAYLRIVVLNFCDECNLLREVSRNHMWMPAMLCEILLNNPSFPRKTKTKLADMCDKDAILVGKGLSSALMTGGETLLAWSIWTSEHPVTLEIAARYPWFELMIKATMGRLLKRVVWGVKLRVGAASSLSLMNLVTNVYVVTTYMQIENQQWVAWATLVTTGLSMLLTAVITIVVWGKGGKRVVLLEVLSIPIGIRPGVLAYRVTAGEAPPSYHILSTYQYEMNVCKVLELFADTIPSGLLQTYALANRDDSSKGAVLSILVSVLCTAFTATNISFEMDIKRRNREQRPWYFGYVPDDPDKRMITFFAMFLNSAAHTMSRSIAVALFLSYSPAAFLCYTAVDIAVFMVYKGLKGDFFTYIWGPKAPYVTSFIHKLVIKSLTDSAGLVLWSHPREVGGLYWTSTVVQNQVVCWVAAALYLSSGQAKLSTGFVCGSLGATTAIWVVSSVAFFRLINEGFGRAIFMNTMTSSEELCKVWRVAKSDYARACVITNQRAEHFDGVREEIKLWVLTNFDAWRRDRPDFFTDELVKRIPPDMLPERFREQAVKQRSDRRRRSSFGLKTVTVGAFVNTLLRTDASAASSGPDAPSKLMASRRMSKLTTSPKSSHKEKEKTEDGLQMQPRSARQKQSPKLKTLLKTFSEAEPPYSAKLDSPRTAR